MSRAIERLDEAGKSSPTHLEQVKGSIESWWKQLIIDELGRQLSGSTKATVRLAAPICLDAARFQSNVESRMGGCCKCGTPYISNVVDRSECFRGRIFKWQKN